MTAGLLIVLAIVLILPFSLKIVEQNLEVFLFIMGISAVIISGTFSSKLFEEILQNRFLYFITIAVFVSSILFRLLKNVIRSFINKILVLMPLKIFVMLLIIVLGLASSVITAIIAALILVEIINLLPVNRGERIHIDIIACFAIGLGAVLTPVGEPLSTVVVTKMNTDFMYLIREVGIYIIPGIIILGLVGFFYIRNGSINTDLPDEIEEEETYKDSFIRTGKIFLFVLALELLGTGFKPLVDMYVIQLKSWLLYWINMISAILDNATLTAAEVSNKMSSLQIQAVLMGLLVSGGMLIPGNIPNIISAGKLRIKSKEWARLGVPLGLGIMSVYFGIIFLI
ncbi:MAG: DUF1646 family protein [Bacillota bacterium]|nr:DUF1646 family protein [Bacillota bacterium]